MTPSPCPVVPIPCGTRFLWRLSVRLDPFTSVLIAVVALASFFPCEGQVAVWFGLLTKLAVALLKIGLATGFVEQRYPGFAKDIEVKRQRVITALQEEQKKQQH